MVAVLNCIGMRDSLKWRKELDFVACTNQVMGDWRDMAHRLIEVLDSSFSHG